MTTISVELSDDFKSIICEFPFDYVVKEAVKLFVPASRWLPVRKAWKLPLVWSSCEGLRAAATSSGATLDIGPQLRVWALAEKARQASIPDQQLMELSKDGHDWSGVLEREYPRIWEASGKRAFQRVGIKYIATARAALMADEPGVGKTIQTIGGIIESGVTGPILIVAAPKSAAVITWPAELRKWAPQDTVITISGKDKADDRAEKARQAQQFEQAFPGQRLWVITSPDYIRMRAETNQYGNYVQPKKIKPVAHAVPELHDITWSAIVADESHKTLACHTLNRKKWSAQRIGMELLKLRAGGVRVAISGTPFRGKEENAFGTLQWLLPQEHTSYWRWAEQFFIIYQGDPSGFGGQETGEIKDKKSFYKYMKRVMVRRTKAEIAPDLPPKMYGGAPLDPNDPDSVVAVWLPMEGKQRTQYNQMVKEAAVDLAGGELTANGVLAEMTRLRQFASSAGELKDNTFYPTTESNKLNWLMDFLDELGIAGENPTGTTKIIVASQFTKLLKVIHGYLASVGVEAHLLTGETPEGKRVKMQEEFQSDGGPRVFILNTIAGGASITLDAADHVVIFDDTHNKDDNEQVEDRAHRISRDHQVTIWNLRSLGTIEEGLARRVQAKDDDIKGILDGARGFNRVKQFLTGGKI